ncbi:MAG: hypothetical protein IPP81_19115 [Chitinophagaceae bacterium]|nr:hypothetical protein [Chitinophagaceae bacterium]
MTFKFSLTRLYLISFFFLISCNNQNKNNSKSTTAGDANDFNKVVSDWNNAHSSKDIGVLLNLYDNSILYYGTQKDKNSCIESKLSLFKKYPDYYQQIFGNIQKEKINETDIKCSFVKRVTINQQTKDYPSYLIFSKKQDIWKIINEGDLVTDKYLAKAKDVVIPKDAVKGDYNGDGVLDYAWLVPPNKSECEECGGNCTSYIKFSDNSIPSIKVEMCIGGTPTNLGDLNKNGSDEIGMLPGWCTSCWRDYIVYTYKNDKWIFAVEPFSTHCNQWEEGIKPID